MSPRLNHVLPNLSRWSSFRVETKQSTALLLSPKHPERVVTAHNLSWAHLENRWVPKCPCLLFAMAMEFCESVYFKHQAWLKSLEIFLPHHLLVSISFINVTNWFKVVMLCFFADARSRRRHRSQNGDTMSWAPEHLKPCAPHFKATTCPLGLLRALGLRSGSAQFCPVSLKLLS